MRLLPPLLALPTAVFLMSCSETDSTRDGPASVDLKPAGAAAEKPRNAPTLRDSGTLFAASNLLAWCIVPYDNQNRSPADRVAMLKRLGFTQYVWDWRQAHLKDLPAELREARAAGVKVRGVWLWIDARNDRVGRLSEANQTVIDAVNHAQLPVEFWVGFHANVFEQPEESARVAHGAAMISHLREQVKPTGSTVALYNHGDWFGEPENQLKIIAAAGPHSLGITYNFHHAHGQIDRFGRILPQMLPYLKAVVLNGMKPGGPKILPVGQGTHEAAMIQILQASGYAGPIGILGHVEGADVETVLQTNLSGLRELLSR